jgi:hypothetical protein
MNRPSDLALSPEPIHEQSVDEETNTSLSQDLRRNGAAMSTVDAESQGNETLESPLSESTPNIGPDFQPSTSHPPELEKPLSRCCSTLTVGSAVNFFGTVIVKIL